MKIYSSQISVLFFLLSVMCCSVVYAQPVREKILIDANWHFAFGHPFDATKDFNHGTAYFSYLAKAGNGDGPAAKIFDDRAWRLLNLPHDWAVEQPFSEKGSYSHGFKAVGKGFADKSIGWYRKVINIAESDLGKVLSLKFDGVYRHSKVWFNGHFLGTEESGYNSFEYDISDYVNYGGENTIAVRVDASMEEGWFYEGAGIYRHVYLQKTNPLHVAINGTYVTSDVKDGLAVITAEAYIKNHGSYKGDLQVLQTILDPAGKQVASVNQTCKAPAFYNTASVRSQLTVSKPELWDIDTPNLYTLVTQIKRDGKSIDSYQTSFGIRTIQFDAEQGFFLNGKHLKLQGTNNHQDHAGVGTAMPDELQYFRIKKLKEMGCNAYRCSHHPPTPELLDACDKLGMLVIDETRLMGINFHLDDVKHMIERDRNHPSIICWSVGNEEWAIEGNITGERITKTMQEYTKSIDSTRPVTVGISSGFKSGISSVVDVMGYNYMGNGDIDAHRSEFKQQPGMGTEEGSTFATRGIYFTDDAKHYQSAYDKKPRPSFYSIEEGWKFYAARPYLAGMFIWTGFDYRGEPTPYGWPSVTSYFGMMDICGFPKDNVYYLKSWWEKEPVLHLLPHWNWEGMEGKEIDVWVYSNCDEVELFLNKKSLGKKEMEPYGHLEWKVNYAAGKLEAIGYKDGKKQLIKTQSTTGKPAKIKLTPHKNALSKAGDAAIVNVEVTDKNGLHVPTADNEITFSLKGGGRIIGVGNGNPTSLEKDKFIETTKLISIDNLQEQALQNSTLPKQLPRYSESNWKEAFKNRDYKNLAPAYVYKGDFIIEELSNEDIVSFFYQKTGVEAVVFINGIQVNADVDDDQKYSIPSGLIKNGKNTIHIIATPIHKVKDWDVINTNPGLIQIITPSEQWHRKLFNGFAQIIIEADGSGNQIILSANSENIKEETIKITVR